jgi:hypothetical protein
MSLALISPAYGSGGKPGEPTLTLEPACYVGYNAVDAFLTGFPPFTPFEALLEWNGNALGPIELTTDADGNFNSGEVGHIGDDAPTTFTVTITWAEGVLQESLLVDCPADPAPVPTNPPPTVPVPAEPSADPDQLKLRVLSTRMPARASGLSSRGAGGLVSCSRACEVQVRLFLRGSAARRMGFAGKVGQADARLSADQHRHVIAYPRTPVARKLLDPPAGGSLRLVVKFDATQGREHSAERYTTQAIR